MKNRGKSGSTYIDCNCHQWLKNTFGDAFSKLPSSKTGPGSKFMNDWEIVKKTFNGNDMNKIFRVHLPALGKTLKEKKLSSSAYDVEDFEVLIPA